MGVSDYTEVKAGKRRTRYRVTITRAGRRLIDERLPAGTSKEKAEQYHAKLVGELFDSDRLGVQKVPLIGDVIREYELRVLPTLKGKHFATDCIRALLPHTVGKTLAQIHKAADEFTAASTAYAPATVEHRLTFLKMLAKRATRWKVRNLAGELVPMADRDYSVGIEVPTYKNDRQFYLTKSQVASILRHATPQVRRACWQLFYSGLRRSELYRAVVRDDAYHLADTKNGQPRIVPIPLAIRKFAGRPTMNRDALTVAWKRACRKQGFGHIRLHDLRHSAASMWLNNGADLRIVGMILGHESLASTKRYAHLAIDTARAVMNNVARKVANG